MCGVQSTRLLPDGTAESTSCALLAALYQPWQAGGEGVEES